jgi:hypothetical protein
MGKRCQLQAPAALLPGKQLRYSLYRRLSGPLSRSGRYGKEKDLFPLLGIKPRLLGHPAIPTQLSRLVDV